LSLKILSWQISSLELLNGASNQWLRTKAKTGPLMNCFPVEILSPVRPCHTPPFAIVYLLSDK